MQKQTETEGRLSKIIEESLSATIAAQPHLAQMTKSISVMPFNFGKDMPEVMVVAMPEELLLNARLEYSAMYKALKKQFTNALVLTMRSGEIVPKKGHNPNREREAVVNDLLFPSVVAGRSTEVETRTDMKQHVYLDPKNQCWSDSELRVLEKVLGEVLKDEYRVGIFGAAH